MRTALVTGVSQGLGYHVCRSLKAAGYRVLGAGLAADPANDALDGYEAVDLATRPVPDVFGSERVDVLVNNAAVYLDDPRLGYGDFFSLRVEDLARTFDVNVVAPVQLVLRHGPRMMGRGYGRVVNVSSGMGRLRDADGASFAYRSSKLAVNSLTLTVARHFGPHPGDLAVFSFCPGWIATRMGTVGAPERPEPAADDLVELLDEPADRTNGRFFRGRGELGWDVSDRMRARDPLPP